MPLRTYLPDGDIDLCLVGSGDLLLNDSWAEKLRSLLDLRGHSGTTQVAVTEVQIIHAEARSARRPPGWAGEAHPSTLVGLRPWAPGACSDLASGLLMQVKVVKCMVGGVVVDISANQLGGLATVGFLEEVRAPSLGGTAVAACARWAAGGEPFCGPPGQGRPSRLGALSLGVILQPPPLGA